MAVNLDPVLGAQEEAELKRKEKVLGLLIADREKPSTSSRRRVGAHSEGH